MSRRTTIAISLAIALASAIPATLAVIPASAQPAQQGTNLLVNPGFEGLSCPGGRPDQAECNATHIVHIQDGIIRDNIRTPEGWVTWWREDPTNGWTQPEVVIASQADPYLNPPRIRTGSYAMKVFGSHGGFDGGFYQVVGGLTPGATVSLAAYAHTWTCTSYTGGDHGPGTTCGDLWAMPLSVGIEPNGVADPFSPSIIWSTDYYYPDNYGLVGPVTTRVGAGGTICVYLRSWSKWATRGGNDAYWDDAVLVYGGQVAPPTIPAATATSVPAATATSGPAATATSGPSPTPGPTSTPRPTPTPRPDGSVVHVVEPGDTLSVIAEQYGVSVDQIRQLNAGSIGENDLIEVGQELVISAPSIQATSTATSTPKATPPVAATETLATFTPTVAPSPAPASASICVLAYQDRNGDNVRDAAAEELLPNVVFTLSGASGEVGQYSTTGTSEPYCFTDLAPGVYRVSMAPPAGYAPGDLAEQNTAVTAGATLPLEFSVRRSENPASGNATPAPPTGTQSSSGLKIIALVEGGLVVILAVVLGLVFFRKRR
jgi:LysM repeat protein